MSHRIEQINELLKSKLAILVTREVPMENGLITIVYVDCSPDLRNAKIKISVLPFNLSESVLKRLRKQSSIFSEILKKETRLRKIPKFTWAIDETEESASEIEKILNDIKKEEE